MTVPRSSSFWTSLPAILSGVAALITAIVGLLVFLNGGNTNESEPTTPATQPTAGIVTQGLSSEQITEVTLQGDLTLNALVNACGARDFAACDQLYAQSPAGSDEELYGGFCAGFNPYNAEGNCQLISTNTDACAFGDQAACETLFTLAAVACEAGDVQACFLLQ